MNIVKREAHERKRMKNIGEGEVLDRRINKS